MEPIQVALRKQYTQVQRTKPSIQILKNYQCGKMLRQDSDFSTIHAGKRGTTEAGKNSVIYMGLISGPNTGDDTCGKTTVTGTMDRGFTV
jgi:hypothetical protein